MRINHLFTLIALVTISAFLVLISIPILYVLSIFIISSAIYIIARKRVQVDWKNRNVFIHAILMLIATSWIIAIVVDENSPAISQGKFYFTNPNSEVEIGNAGVEYYIFRGEQANSNGSFEPIFVLNRTENYISAPVSNMIYLSRVNPTTTFSFNLSIQSSAMVENVTCEFYSDIDTNDANKTLIRYEIISNPTFVERRINAIYSNTSFFTKIITIVVPNPTRILLFRFKLNLNSSHYNNMTDITYPIPNGDIYFADNWISITSLPEGAYDGQEEWGKTSSMNFSISGLLGSEFGVMGLCAVVFTGIFVILFLISFLLQNNTVTRWFFFIFIIISFIILFYFLSDTTPGSPFIQDIINFLNWFKDNFGNDLINTWLLSFVYFFKGADLLITVISWVCTLGLTLLICKFLMQAIEMISFSRSH